MTKQNIYAALRSELLKYHQLSNDLSTRLSAEHDSALSRRWEQLEWFIDGMEHALLVVSIEMKKGGKQK